MNVFVNNKATETVNDSNIAELLTSLKISVRGTAVAIDNKVIGKPLWETTTLAEGSKITIIKATQGG